ncbi:cell surface glycoprotein CD200 receptor 1 isoform X2 [Rhinolophus sinicus]|uniref:cell surface glycoprotein CD200 receptor 1 isoform X2 n=1 Tax=Rhinolophus sinicus TaxID=89399 RepID=UPI003D7A8063
MPCTWKTSDLQLLLILTVFLVAECISARVEGPVSNSTQQMGKNNYSLALSMDGMQNDSKRLAEAYRSDNNVTKETNCTDKRITWALRPDQNSSLQIDPVAITHDGYYRCLKVTPDGNFHRGYNLQVLVAPEVTLFRSNNGTAVCKAVAGKPAARIFWIPEGDCVPKQENWGNGTVTVWSTCHWADNNVSNVSCFVSHLSGIRNLTIELSRGAQKSDGISISRVLLFMLISLILLAIVGSIWLLKSSGCRKCKLKKIEGTPVEEDEMQPYASYTEKKNPLYDNIERVKTSQVLQSEVDGTELHAF